MMHGKQRAALNYYRTIGSVRNVSLTSHRLNQAAKMLVHTERVGPKKLGMGWQLGNPCQTRNKMFGSLLVLPHPALCQYLEVLALRRRSF